MCKSQVQTNGKKTELVKLEIKATNYIYNSSILVIVLLLLLIIIIVIIFEASSRLWIPEALYLNDQISKCGKLNV